MTVQPPVFRPIAHLEARRAAARQAADLVSPSALPNDAPVPTEMVVAASVVPVAAPWRPSTAPAEQLMASDARLARIEAQMAAIAAADEAQIAARSAARLADLVRQYPHPTLLLGHAADVELTASDRDRLIVYCQQKMRGVRIQIEQKQRMEQRQPSARLRRVGQWLLDRSPGQRIGAFFSLIGLVGGWLIIDQIVAATFPNSWRPAFVQCEFQITSPDRSEPTILFPRGRKMLVERSTGRVVYFSPITRMWTELDAISQYLVPGCAGTAQPQPNR